MQIDIGISEKNRKAIAQILNDLLSDEYTLYTKTLNYHWDVQGTHFYSLHKFFEDQYKELFVIIDDVAERVRTLGFKPYGTLFDFIENSAINEDPHDLSKDELGMIAQLLFDHEVIIKQLRKDIPLIGSRYKDIGTDNFLTEILEKHEKMAWMLRSFFKKEIK